MSTYGIGETFDIFASKATQGSTSSEQNEVPAPREEWDLKASGFGQPLTAAGCAPFPKYIPQ